MISYLTSADMSIIAFIGVIFAFALTCIAIAKLNKFGIYSKIKNIHNSPHSFWFFHPWFEEMVESTTDFLDKIFKTKIN